MPFRRATLAAEPHLEHSSHYAKKLRDVRYQGVVLWPPKHYREADMRLERYTRGIKTAFDYV